MTLAARLAGLGARFDGAALDAYALITGPAAASAWPALRAWCLAAPGEPLRVAVPAAAAHAQAAQRAAAVALELDGSHALAACSGHAQRMALRLRVKWQDLQGAAALAGAAATAMPVHVVWDCGRARAPAALARFTPRRASLVVIDHGAAPAWLQALQTLHRRSAGLAWPLRVLWLLEQPRSGAHAGASAAADPDPDPAVTRGWALLPP